jgi:hypothetical protein
MREKKVKNPATVRGASMLRGEVVVRSEKEGEDIIV